MEPTKMEISIQELLMLLGKANAEGYVKDKRIESLTHALHTVQADKATQADQPVPVEGTGMAKGKG